jgi:hypothetical protein
MRWAMSQTGPFPMAMPSDAAPSKGETAKGLGGELTPRQRGRPRWLQYVSTDTNSIGTDTALSKTSTTISVVDESVPPNPAIYGIRRATNRIQALKTRGFQQSKLTPIQFQFNSSGGYK